jgi:hypothetical protein
VQAAPPDVFSPMPRVVCDRKGWACFDAHGASLPLTRAHLGDRAAKVFQERMAKRGKGWQQSNFLLSNGVACSTEQRACYTREGGSEIEPKITEALFGRLPSTTGAGR